MKEDLKQTENQNDWTKLKIPDQLKRINRPSAVFLTDAESVFPASLLTSPDRKAATLISTVNPSNNIEMRVDDNGRFKLTANDFSITRPSAVISLHQIFGHTSGWAPAIAAEAKQSNLLDCFHFGLVPGTNDAENFKARMKTLDINPDVQPFFYLDGLTTLADPSLPNKVIPGLNLTPGEIALITLWQNIELVTLMLESKSTVIFNDMRFEASLFGNLLKNSHRQTAMIGNRYAFLDASIAWQVLNDKFLTPDEKTAIGRSIFGKHTIEKFIKQLNLPNQLAKDLDFFKATSKKATSLAEGGKNHLMLYQTLDPDCQVNNNVLPIPPLCNQENTSLPENLAEIVQKTKNQDTIVVAQGTGIYSFRQQTWETMINIAKNSPQRLFILLGLNQNELTTIGQQTPENCHILGWIPTFQTFIRSILNTANRTLLICRPGVSTIGQACAIGVPFLLTPPDKLPDPTFPNAQELLFVPEVAPERAIVCLQAIKFVNSNLGLGNRPPIVSSLELMTNNIDLSLKHFDQFRNLLTNHPSKFTAYTLVTMLRLAAENPDQLVQNTDRFHSLFWKGETQ